MDSSIATVSIFSNLSFSGFIFILAVFFILGSFFFSVKKEFSFLILMTCLLFTNPSEEEFINFNIKNSDIEPLELSNIKKDNFVFFSVYKARDSNDEYIGVLGNFYNKKSINISNMIDSLSDNAAYFSIIIIDNYF